MITLGYKSLIWIRLTPIIARQYTQVCRHHPGFILDHNTRFYSRLLQSADKRVKRHKSALKKQVILIDHNGTSLGSMTRQVAMELAEAQGMELVDVSKKDKGEQEQVCRMMTKKEIWERDKRKREIEKNRRSDVTKEIKIATVISDHDISTKLSQMQKMLEKKQKVKLIIEPRLKRYQWEIDELREEEQQKQRELLVSIVERINEFGDPINKEKWQGRYLAITLKPR